jgi:hypothetical protein
MRIITKIDANKLATGILDLLIQMKKDTGEASYPVPLFEKYIIEQHGVPKEEAERVTEAVLSTSIIRWDIIENNFVI